MRAQMQRMTAELAAQFKSAGAHPLASSVAATAAHDTSAQQQQAAEALRQQPAGLLLQVGEQLSRVQAEAQAVAVSQQQATASGLQAAARTRAQLTEAAERTQVQPAEIRTPATY
jgi:putative heme iron utilization protein